MTNNQQWRTLLAEAFRTPGLLHEAYHRFPGYSLHNQLLALHQCRERGLSPGPLGTFLHWQRLGRKVRRGERAITLCISITRKTSDDEEDVINGFAYRRRWFVQGIGQPVGGTHSGHGDGIPDAVGSVRCV